MSLKTQLEDWVFVPSTGHQNWLDKSLWETLKLGTLKLQWQVWDISCGVSSWEVNFTGKILVWYDK